MSEESDKIISSLPQITGDGLFQVNIVVPNTDSLFNAMESNQSTSYSYPLMDPAKLIGVGSQPFMNVALPAYITTLYNNVFNINNNLRNDISTSAIDDRKYPTSYAVQQYVQSQLAGTQLINGNSNINNTFIVNTTLNNTLIQTAVTAAQNFSYSYDGAVKSIYLFWMDTNKDEPRSGSSKIVMFAAKDCLKDLTGTVTGNLALLYAGDSSNFIYMGIQYKYYQFVYVGDYVQFIQAYSSSSDSWDWLVTGCMGVFTNEINVPGGITKTSNTAPTPTYGFGNLSSNN